MKDINKFIVNSKLNDLIAFCDESDKAILSDLLDKYKLSYSEITDGKRKKCNCCGVVKSLDEFKTHRKGDMITHTNKCYDCYDRECAKRTLFKTNISSLIEPHEEALESMKDCYNCPLALKDGDFRYNDENNPECARCMPLLRKAYSDFDEKREMLEESLKSVIKDDHVELKVMLNHITSRIRDYKRNLVRNE